MHDIEQRLAKYAGCHVRLWDFSPSHDMLVMQLELESRIEYLVLSGCEEIMTPVAWRLAVPRISSERAPYVEFRDERVRILCQDISIHPDHKRSGT